MYVSTYVCMHVCMHIHRYICMYLYIYIFVRTYIYVCVCVCLSHEEITTASSFNFWSSQFHSQSQLSVSPCLSCNTKNTDEFWIYAGITLRQWLSDVTVICFQSVSDNIKCTARYRQILTLFWRKQLISSRSNLLCLERSCWLSAFTFAAVLLVLKETA